MSDDNDNKSQQASIRKYSGKYKFSPNKSSNNSESTVNRSSQNIINYSRSSKSSHLGQS